MVLSALDPSIPQLLRNSFTAHHRSVFLIIGSNPVHALPPLLNVRSKCSLSRPSLLWCYKSDLSFSSHAKKRMKKSKSLAKKGLQTQESTDFDNFLNTHDITYLYYRDSNNALGKTYDVLVLQDFETLTPGLLAATVETVRGGGTVVFLLKGVQSLRQVYSLR